jgi:ABC-2 type transport system permease protein
MKSIGREITKLLSLKRTYLGWVVLSLVPIIMVLALDLSTKKPPPGEGPPFFSSIANNGIFVPLSSMVFLSFFFLPLTSAMAGGYSIAGEAEMGTMKTWLVRPVSRGAVLLSKWFAAVLYVFIAMIIAGVIGGLVGWAVFGAHPLVTFSGSTVPVGRGLELIGMTYLLLFMEMVVIVSIAVLISAWTDSSLAAAVGSLVVMLVMAAVISFSYFAFLKPYVFMSRVDAWQGLWRTPIEWHAIRDAVITYAVYIVVLVTAAWYIFRRKDILS